MGPPHDQTWNKQDPQSHVGEALDMLHADTFTHFRPPLRCVAFLSVLMRINLRVAGLVLYQVSVIYGYETFTTSTESQCSMK